MGRGAEGAAAGSLIGRKYIEPVLFTRLLETLPSQCALCRGWDTTRLCHDCVARFATPVPRCLSCALQVPAGVNSCGTCLKTPPPWDAALAAVDYAYPWDGLIPSFKFDAALDLAGALTQRLAAAAQRRPKPDLLLPVPLGPQRLRQRGYNQAWEIARRLGKALNVSADAHLLLRVKETAHQLSQPVKQRAANVRGAFAVEPLRRSEIAGRSVAIVDDVMTTGATCGEIAQVLKQAGASRVEAWVLARTPRPDTR
jgi:ComF family protein